jgi:hypothetical protein
LLTQLASNGGPNQLVVSLTWWLTLGNPLVISTSCQAAVNLLAHCICLANLVYTEPGTDSTGGAFTLLSLLLTLLLLLKNHDS